MGDDVPERIEVLPGERYCRLVIISEAPKKNRCRRFNCICDCGNKTVSRLNCLRNGETKSCGCLKNDILIKMNTVHGHSRTPLYKVWTAIKQRCGNKKCDSYKYYGERGIIICDEWLAFEVFMEWAIISGYKKGLTIERVDNDGNYEPSNCTWIPQSEQSKNRRNCLVNKK